VDEHAKVLDSLLESPAWKLLGIQKEEYGEGYAKLSLESREEFLQSYSMLQGGILFALMDACAAAAVCPLVAPRNAVTLEAKVNYIRSVRQGRVYAEAKIFHSGRTTVVCQCTAFDEKHNHLALGVFTFSVID
jgi:uncharacterized protein (TIGR00369 family)